MAASLLVGGSSFSMPAGWVILWCFMVLEGPLVGFRLRGHDGTLSSFSVEVALLTLSLCRFKVTLA